MGTGGTRLGVLSAATAGNALGVTSTIHAPFGLFLIPLASQFHWPRASISVVLGFIALAGAIIYPIAGRWADRHGARQILLLGMILSAIGIASLALTNGNIWQFYASFAFIAVVGALGNTAIYSKIVSDWFVNARGTMLGISAGGGNGIGATLVPVLAAIVVAGWGWRAGYLAIAATVLLIGLPILWFGLRDAPRRVWRDDAETGAEAGGLSLQDAARLPVFWLLLLAIAAGAGCTTAVFSHVIPILAERGIGPAIGTTVLAVFALVTAAWQIAMGTILDRNCSPRIVGPMFTFAAAGLLVLEFGSGMTALIGGGVLLGIGLGTQYGALPFLAARYFGLRHFGTIVGAMYSAVALVQGLTPILLDRAFDVQGTYRIAVEVICLCLVVGGGLLLLLPAYRANYGAAAMGV